MNEQISGDCRAERAAVELISRSSGAARKGEGEKLPLWVYGKIGRQLIC